MTKAELKTRYLEIRDRYVAGMLYNEYALELDTLLVNYFGLPLWNPVDDDDDAEEG
jgi:hypothetical protein